MLTLLTAMLLLAVDGGEPDAGVPGLTFDGGMPPAGTYWVIRQHRPWGGGTSGYGDGPMRTVRSWQGACERLRVDRDTLRLGDDLTFAVVKDRVVAPSYVNRHRKSVRAEGHCSAQWPKQPVYASSRDCNVALPSRLQQTCVDAVCSWNTEPWSLEGCEPALVRLRALAAVGAEPTHPEALRTLQRFEAILGRGGSMWALPGCERVKFDARDGEGMTKVHTTNAFASWEAIGALEPLFGQARFVSEFTSYDGGGMSSGGSGRLDLILLGKDQVALGDRVLVFAPKQCSQP